MRDDPRLYDAVSIFDPKQLAAFPTFEADFSAYLAEYGHRETVTPILVTPPTQRDAPDTVLALIKVLAPEPPRPPQDQERVLHKLLQHPLLRGSPQRTGVTRWVEAARAGMAFREDSHFYFLMPLPILRTSLLGELVAGCTMSDCSRSPGTSFTSGWRSSKRSMIRRRSRTQIGCARPCAPDRPAARSWRGFG